MRATTGDNNHRRVEDAIAVLAGSLRNFCNAARCAAGRGLPVTRLPRRATASPLLAGVPPYRPVVLTLLNASGHQLPATPRWKLQRFSRVLEERQEEAVS